MLKFLDARQIFFAKIDNLSHMEHEYGTFAAKLERASKELNKKSKQGGVHAHLVLAAELGAETQKDMSWEEAL